MAAAVAAPTPPPRRLVTTHPRRHERRPVRRDHGRPRHVRRAAQLALGGARTRACGADWRVHFLNGAPWPRVGRGAARSLLSRRRDARSRVRRGRAAPALPRSRLLRFHVRVPRRPAAPLRARRCDVCAFSDARVSVTVYSRARARVRGALWCHSCVSGRARAQVRCAVQDGAEPPREGNEEGARGNEGGSGGTRACTPRVHIPTCAVHSRVTRTARRRSPPTRPRPRCRSHSWWRPARPRPARCSPLSPTAAVGDPPVWRWRTRATPPPWRSVVCRVVCDCACSAVN